MGVPETGENQAQAGAYSGDFGAARAWHLARDTRGEMTTSFEFALMQVFEAFQRWVIQVAHVASHPDINYNEVVVLNVVRMQERAKDAATIAKLVNRDDLPNVLYNLRKLVALGLVEKAKVGSGTYFQVTERGRLETDRYAALRNDILLRSMNQVSSIDAKLETVTTLLKVMTGLYDSAARETAVINPVALFPDVEERHRRAPNGSQTD